MENKKEEKIGVEIIPNTDTDPTKETKEKETVSSPPKKQVVQTTNLEETDAPGKTIEIKGDEIIDESETKIIPKTKNFLTKDSLIKKDQSLKKKISSVLTPDKKEEKGSLLKTVRTYQDDVVKIMKEQKTSLTKMVIAEKKKGGASKKEVAKEKTPKKPFIIGIFISVIVVSGLVGFYFLNTKTTTQTIEVTELKIPTFIFPNYVREVFLTRLKRDKIIEAFENENFSTSIPLGSIIQLYLTKEDQTKQFVIEETRGNKLLITTEVFFDTIEAKVPSLLIRALGSDFMFGYHSSLGNNPFLLFKVKSYNNAFSEMIEWEKTMFKDLSPTFVKEGSDIDIESNNFKDIIISNKDVRAVLNSKGKVEFAYSFPNKETLVIINNETTFQELLRRIVNVNLERKD